MAEWISVGEGALLKHPRIDCVLRPRPLGVRQAPERPGSGCRGTLAQARNRNAAVPPRRPRLPSPPRPTSRRLQSRPLVVSSRGVYAVETKSFRKPKRAKAERNYSVRFDDKVLHFPDFVETKAVEQAERYASAGKDTA